MGLPRKRISVEELAATLALICAQSVNTVYKLLLSDPIERVKAALAYVSGSDLYLELWCLARFAVDFGVTHELGQANPQRNAILDGCTYFILDASDITGLPSDFLEKSNHRLLKYSLALKHHHDISAASRSIGIEFAQSLELTKDHLLASGATNFFGRIVCDVIDLLRSCKITQE